MFKGNFSLIYSNHNTNKHATHTSDVRVQRREVHLLEGQRHHRKRLFSSHGKYSPRTETNNQTKVIGFRIRVVADALASHPRAEENLPALRVQETNEKPMGERRPDVLRFVVHFCRSVCDWVLFYVRDERDGERVVGDYVGRVFRLYRVRVRDRDGVLVLGEQVYDDENEKRRE